MEIIKRMKLRMKRCKNKLICFFDSLFKMKNLLWLTGILILASCGGAKVSYDYDQKNNFSKYQSYALDSNHRTGLEEIDEKRLYSLIEAELQQKGMRYSEEPDVLVFASAHVAQGASRANVGIGIGSGGRHVGGGVTVNVPLSVPNSRVSIKFEVEDAHTNQLVWQAVATKETGRNNTAEKREELLSGMVSEAFEKYPPK